MKVALVCIALAGACKPSHDDFGAHFYSRPGDRVICSKGADRDHEWPMARLMASLEVAHDRGVVLQTNGHATGQWNKGIDIQEYGPAFDWAYANGVKTVTFRELASGYEGAGWAFTVDDNEVDTWFGWREFLKQHHAHVTFFVTKWDAITPDQRAKLAQLVADGNDVEAHGKQHLDAKQTVAAHGFTAYYNDEVKPNVDDLTAAGYHPVAFAYPYGAHSRAIDQGMLEHFELVRTTGGAHCGEP